jgi:hypothetical protein
MAYSLINGISFLVGLVFVYNGYRLVRHGREDLVWFLVSSFVGVGLIVVSVYPAIFSIVADLIGLEWRARAILVVSNITLFVLVLFLLNVIKDIHDKLSRLNEELSLLRAEVEGRDDGQ